MSVSLNFHLFNFFFTSDVTYWAFTQIPRHSAIKKYIFFLTQWPTKFYCLFPKMFRCHQFWVGTHFNGRFEIKTKKILLLLLGGANIVFTFLFFSIRALCTHPPIIPISMRWYDDIINLSSKWIKTPNWWTLLSISYKDIVMLARIKI